MRYDEDGRQATVTRPLDPAGRGWTLQQLRRAGLAAAAGPETLG
jgi:ribosomal protein L13E